MNKIALILASWYQIKFQGHKIIAPQARFQPVGLGTKAPDDVRVECLLACLSVGGVVLFEELVRETASIDFYKIENLA